MKQMGIKGLMGLRGITGFFIPLILSTFYLLLSTSVAQAGIKPPPSSLGLVGYWSFDDCKGATSTDFSGNGNTGTLTNFALSGSTSNWVSGNSAKRGCALSFDGTNDYVDLGNSSALNITSPSITVSAWVNRTDTTKYMVPIARRNGTSEQYQFTWLKSNDASFPNKIRLDLSLGGSVVSFNSTNTYTVSGWHHIAATYDGASVKLYFDGVLDSTTNETRSIDTYAVNNYIGTDNYTSPSYSSGSIDETRVYNRALTATEVTALYNAGSAKLKTPDNTGLVGYWSFEDGRGTTATDFSGQRNNGTLTNFTLSTSTSNWNTGNACKRGNCLNFDGTNDYVDMGNPNSVNLSGTPTSISIWVKGGAQGITKHIVSKTNGSNDGYAIETGTGGIRFYTFPGGFSTEIPQASIWDNKWHHVVGVCNGATTFIYLDGVSQNITGCGSLSVASATNLVLGRYTGGGFNFNGSLDEVRIYNRALSATDVTNLYQSGLVKIASTAQLQQGTNLVSGLVGHWTFDGQYLTTSTASDTSGQGNNGTLSNGPAPTAGRLGQALQFDGTDDYVTIPDANSLDLSTNASVFAWIKRTNNVAGYETLISKRSGGSPNYEISIDTSAAAKKLLFYNGTIFTANSILPVGEWIHVGFVNSAGSLTFYLNGVADGSTSAALGATNAGTLNIGTAYAGAGQYLRASVDDVRIYNRALSANEVQQLYGLGR